ncbi:hypothetical protein [Methyloglobulus sp.]|uniref:hypothetical protein n=1 Tax=Methyloglobulus sp. TaxID=2518622 RepID=UPI003989878B
MLTDNGIKAMGYEENNPPFLIKCKFYCLKVYCIRGVNFASDDSVLIDQLSPYTTFGIGNNVNDICMKLANDIYCEDIEKWKVEKKADAPFLVTLTSKAIDYSNSCKWLQMLEGQIHTYNCFSMAQADLDVCIADYEMPFIPLIAAMLTSTQNLVKLTHVDTCKYAVTAEGNCLIDSQVSSWGSLSTSTKISLEKSFKSIVNKLPTYKSQGESVSRLLYEVMQEPDKIKSFLLAWAALEVFVTETFKSQGIKEFPEKGLPDAYRERVTKLFSDPKRGREITSVGQKYAYLSVFLWIFLNVDDYDEFMKAKKMREFYHGKKINSNALPTKQILLLVNKIIQNA